ncbi:hypothetical protein [Sabulicella glaciei]|uniref:Plasmid recombination enzyme n=1 Tax=Sabulicella glaciei TaxID=2984948 RepID=A0ABT3P1E4_9PROT|nr:hypothetical protein [Roseococcus sp. MDT2-1-1]MCW8088248.1 hypothetical protein [Roseococcus sp. MDT2-1-1]
MADPGPHSRAGRETSFIRVESFALKPHPRQKEVDARGIVHEAMRDPAYCQHVSSPQPPQLIFGEAFDIILDEAIERHREASDIQGRRRRDDNVMLSSWVVSCHIPVAELEMPGKQAEYGRWLELTLIFLKERLGSCLRGCVLHLDEAHPHIHALALPPLKPVTDPDGNPRMDRSGRPHFILDVGATDPFRAARAAALAAHPRKRAGWEKHAQAAARQAGADLQLHYWKAAGAPFGLATPVGAQGQRLKRADALAERAAEARTTELQEKVRTLGQRVLEAEKGAVRFAALLVAGPAAAAAAPPRREPTEAEKAARAAIRLEVAKAAEQRVGSEFRVQRMTPDGLIEVGGGPLRPGERLRPDPEDLAAIERARVGEGAFPWTAYLQRLAFERAAGDAALKEADALHSRLEAAEAKVDHVAAERDGALRALGDVRTRADQLAAIVETHPKTILKMQAAQEVAARRADEAGATLATVRLDMVRLQEERDGALLALGSQQKHSERLATSLKSQTAATAEARAAQEAAEGQATAASHALAAVQVEMKRLKEEYSAERQAREAAERSAAHQAEAWQKLQRDIEEKHAQEMAALVAGYQAAAEAMEQAHSAAILALRGERDKATAMARETCGKLEDTTLELQKAERERGEAAKALTVARAALEAARRETEEARHSQASAVRQRDEMRAARDAATSEADQAKADAARLSAENARLEESLEAQAQSAPINQPPAKQDTAPEEEVREQSKQTRNETPDGHDQAADGPTKETRMTEDPPPNMQALMPFIRLGIDAGIAGMSTDELHAAGVPRHNCREAAAAKAGFQEGRRPDRAADLDALALRIADTLAQNPKFLALGTSQAERKAARENHTARLATKRRLGPAAPAQGDARSQERAAAVRGD